MALGSFFNRLKEGLSRSTTRITETLTTVFKKRRLDDEALEELEELLISADLGVDAAARVIAAFRRSRFGKEVTDEEIKQALAEEIAAILSPVAKPLVLDPARKQEYVNAVFDTVAGSYDRFTRLCSFGMDVVWKRELVRLVRERLRPNDVVADLATGTGDLAFLLAPFVRLGEVIGIDICDRMLHLAEQTRRRREASNVTQPSRSARDRA